MTTFFETLLGGLALAAVTALTLVAYKHPKTYARVYNVMSVGLMTICVLWMTFAIGKMVGQYEANEITRGLNEGTVITGSVKSPVGWQFFVWPVGSAYLILLSFFPALFKEERTPNNQAPNKTTDDEGS